MPVQRSRPLANRESDMNKGLHHIGLATGDPTLFGQPLAPGMVFTVEPWYYNHDIEIAVFIEEEVLVTANGAEILTGMLPRTPGELEAIVRGR